MVDYSTMIPNFSGLGAYLPIFQIFFLFLLLSWMVLIFPYIKAGTIALIYGRMLGNSKINIVGNDNHIRTTWANFLEDFETYSNKAYIIDRREIKIDEFGNKTLFYTQDFTEPIDFIPFKKYVYKDIATGEILKDDKGEYVSKLTLIDKIKKKYRKELSPESKEIMELIQPTILDNVVKKSSKVTDVLYPTKISELGRGIDSTLTADVIVRRMKIELLSFIEKHWKHLFIFGAGMLIGIAIIIIITYSLSKKFDDLIPIMQMVKNNIVMAE